MEQIEKYLIVSMVLNPDRILEVGFMMTADALIGKEYKEIFNFLLLKTELREEIDRFTLYTSGKFNPKILDSIFSITGEEIIFEPTRFAEMILRRNYEQKIENTIKIKDYELAREEMKKLESIADVVEFKGVGDLKDLREGIIYRTGFHGLDKKVNFVNGDLIIIAGRTGIGKTTLGLNMLTFMAFTQPVGLISLEMSEGGLAQRFQKFMTESERTMVGKNFIISIPSNFTIGNVRKIIREMTLKRQTKIIMVDYLQLISDLRKYPSRHLEVSYIIRQLKEMAKEYQVGLIVVSQLSRSIDHRGDKSKPMLGDLKETGDIEYAGDIILFLHRERDEDNLTDLIIAKNRYGERGICNIIWLPERISYGNYARTEDRYAD